MKLDRAIAWAVAELKRDGLEDVHHQAVTVPRWVRGHESADIVEPASRSLAMLGLGGSVSTPAQGVRAEVIVVHSVADLDAHASRASGRIVVFNVPFTTYDETRPIRTEGASRAAKLGAVGALVRSVGPPGLRLPHTGSLTYSADAAKIPAAAISTEDADLLQRMSDRGTRVVVQLKMEAHTEPDVQSANVVAELRGRELPDRVNRRWQPHLDSWDWARAPQATMAMDVWRHGRSASWKTQVAAAPDGPPRLVDQRRERHARCSRPIATHIARSSPAT